MGKSYLLTFPGGFLRAFFAKPLMLEGLVQLAGAFHSGWLEKR
jgi:hypothetical protein